MIKLLDIHIQFLLLFYKTMSPSSFSINSYWIKVKDYLLQVIINKSVVLVYISTD